MSMNQPHPTPVRMPPELKEWIKEAAHQNRRSVNAEIILLLTQARERAGRSAP